MHPHEAAKVLKIPKARDFEEIKRAYKVQSIKFHPDKNSEPQAEQKFKRIGEAFRTLREYAEEGGQFPIPKPDSFRGVHGPSQPPFRQAKPTVDWAQYQKKDRRKARVEVVAPRERRDRSWRKARYKVGNSPSQVGSGGTTGSVQFNTFYEDLNRYLDRVFAGAKPEDIDRELKAKYGPNIHVGDISDILANHKMGQPPIHISYDQSGHRRVDPYSTRSSSRMAPFGSSYTVGAGRVPYGHSYGTTGNPAPQQQYCAPNQTPVPPSAPPPPPIPPQQVELHVHPSIYHNYMAALHNGAQSLSLFGQLVDRSNGGAMMGVHSVTTSEGQQYCNGYPCMVVLNQAIPMS